MLDKSILDIALLLVVMNLAMVVIWLVFPVVTTIQCWVSVERSRIRKVLWTIFILLTAPFFITGSFVFAFVTYSKYYKLLTVFILVIFCLPYYVLLSGKLIPGVGQELANSVELVISDSVEDSPQHAVMMENLKVLRKDSKEGELNAFLMIRYMLAISFDGLTDEEYKNWLSFYEKYPGFSDVDVKAIEHEIELITLKRKATQRPSHESKNNTVGIQ